MGSSFGLDFVADLGSNHESDGSNLG